MKWFTYTFNEVYKKTKYLSLIGVVLVSSLILSSAGLPSWLRPMNSEAGLKSNSDTNSQDADRKQTANTKWSSIFNKEKTQIPTTNILQDSYFSGDLAIGNTGLNPIDAKLQVEDSVETDVRLWQPALNDTLFNAHINFFNPITSPANPIGLIGYDDPTNNHLRILNRSINGSLILGTGGSDHFAIDSDGWSQTATGLWLYHTAWISPTGQFGEGISFEELTNYLVIKDVIPSFQSTADAAALAEGTVFKVSNGDGTSVLHIRD